MDRMTTMTTTAQISAADAAANLEAAFEAFKVQHPEIVDAMAAMNLSFPAYLEALAAMQENGTITSGNGTAA